MTTDAIERTGGDLGQLREAGRRAVRLRAQCASGMSAARPRSHEIGLRVSVRTSMRCVRVVDSAADQGKRLVGRAGLEPATEGL